MYNHCQYCNYEVNDEKYFCNRTGPDVCEPCQRLSELSEKIANAKRALIDLVEEHETLKEQTNYNHDRLTYRLPPEITGYIFELCTPDDAMDIDLYQTLLTASQPICTPMILSAVCRRWRTIAHSTPRLWTTLLLYPGNSNSFACTVSESLVQEWIDRAGMLPFSINFYTPASMMATTQIVNVLNRCADRWLELKYQGPSELLVQLSENGRELPLLRTLHLTDFYRHAAIKYKLKLNPKRLNTLSITGIKLIAVKFDLHHLIQLEMGYPSLSDCFEALRRAPRLTRCIWSHEADRGREEFPLPRNPIMHSNIRHLEFVQTLLYKKIFQRLSCPSLTTLVFDFTHDPVDIPQIVGFLLTSGCSLERLSLVHAILSASDLVPLWEVIPTLQHLHIGFVFSSPVPHLFGLLAEFSIVNGNKEPLYLPALRSLTLDTDTIHDWTMLPNIFGTPTAHYSTDMDRHRHALESVTILVTTNFGTDLVSLIAEETLKRIVYLREAGVKWDLRLKENKEDIIELAIDWYVWDVVDVGWCGGPFGDKRSRKLSL